MARDAVQQKDYDTATDHLISVLQFDSSNSEAFGIMGDMAFSKKDLNTAEGYYLRRLELTPESYEAHKDMGRLYLSVANTTVLLRNSKQPWNAIKIMATPICI